MCYFSWDAHTGELITLLIGHTQPVNDIALSSDGQTLASGSEDATVRLWELTPEDTPTDLNANGSVNVLDLVIVANAFDKESPMLMATAR